MQPALLTYFSRIKLYCAHPWLGLGLEGPGLGLKILAMTTILLLVVKERIVLREIHLRTTGRHLSMESHSVICHPTEVASPPSPQPGRLVLDLSTP